jgi:RimJ/RimL family protein N-acetyltransferase
MAAVLDDAALHRYTGGRPDSADELRRRYVRQARGRSPDGSERWVNWVVRERASGEAVGYVQATVEDAAGAAELAWVMGSRFQRRGYATEAVQAMVGRLAEEGVALLRAHIHPGHAASAGVARAAGLAPSPVELDGEVRWELRLS